MFFRDFSTFLIVYYFSGHYFYLIFCRFWKSDYQFFRIYHNLLEESKKKYKKKKKELYAIYSCKIIIVILIRFKPLWFNIFSYKIFYIVVINKIRNFLVVAVLIKNKKRFSEWKKYSVIKNWWHFFIQLIDFCLLVLVFSLWQKNSMKKATR